jgi:hypothetical protein
MGIRNIQAPTNRRVREAEAFLSRKHNELHKFDSLENLAVEGEEFLDQNSYNGLMYHMQIIRAELARILWEAEVYVGISIIDEFVFQSAKKAPQAIAQDVVSSLTKTQAGKPGFVLYPLHGFGMKQPILMGNDSMLKPYLLLKNMGVCLSPQSNSFEAAVKRVSEMAAKLGVVGKIDSSDLRHHTSAGAMDWFTRNPLMMVKIASHTGDYYENQFIYTLKIRIAAVLAVMLYALSADRGLQVDGFASSASVNNWQTLDIRHYLIGEAQDKKSRPVDLRRVPMNVAALDLARLSDLPLTLSSQTLDLTFLKAARQSLVPALKTVEAGHLAHVNVPSGDKVRRKVFARIVTALDWYRQSFSARVTDDEAVVSLAVAFETLLTDGYAIGVRDRIERRTSICLKGKHGIADYVASITSVMEARGAIVHNGSTIKEAEIVKAQAAFAFCFIYLVNHLPSLGQSLDQPVARMLGDF